jgi:outer membrane receptor protein involved in Fe transport
MAGISWLTNLKARASWGQVGNQNISDTFYPFASTIDLGGNFMFGNPLTIYQGGRLTSAANPDVTWESSEMVNFGIDFGILNESLCGSVEYYVKNTNDILLTLPIPMVAGLNAPLVNAGKVRNSGVDANLTYKYTTNDVQVRATGILSYLNNEVVDLADTGPFINGRNLIQEGYPINSYSDTRR